MNQTIAMRYQLQDKLGIGGMGTVYKAFDLQSETTVAVKQLKSDIGQPDALARFKREGSALRELNHPNIVKVLDMVEQSGQHYLIMEYLPGGDLKGLLKETKQKSDGGLPVTQVLKIAIDISDALTRAHHLNIIHRDLKPANILLAEDGTPRLTDFGMARILSYGRISDTDTVLGTLDYLAPESIHGEVADPRTDIWSFGVMLFEMLTGNRPFTGPTMAHIVEAIITQAVPNLEELRPDANVALVDLIYRMLEKNRDARVRSVRQVGLELEDMLEGRDSDLALFGNGEPRFDSMSLDVGVRRHNLPAQTTPFVGRESELNELAKLLDSYQIRLVTLVGPGGMGKTRLALELARLYSGEVGNTTPSRELFIHGVFFVDLTPLSNPATIPAAVAEACGYQFQQDARNEKQQMLDFLANKSLLLVIDNWEHLMSGVGLVGEILAAAPKVQILATSRQRLNQPGESLYHVDGMDFSNWESPHAALEYASARLFLNSAQRAQPSFELTYDNLPYVSEICRLVQGMPLGIVLAASWLAVLSPEEIAQEIADGIDILEAEGSALPDRQRSIRAVCDYSWNLMSEDEQTAFMNLSIFQGGFMRDAASEVGGASLRTLMALINKSLVRRDADNGRCTLHGLLRQYAHEKLMSSGGDEVVRDAHAAYFAGFMNDRETDIKGRSQFNGLNLTEIEFENVRAAWQWAFQRKNYKIVDRMVEGVKLFCEMHNRYVDRQTFFVKDREQVAGAADEEAKRLYNRMLVRYAGFLQHREDVRSQFEACLEAARKSNDRVEEAYCLFALGDANASLGDFQQAMSLFHQSIAAYQDIDDKFYLSKIYNRLASGYLFGGQLQLADTFARHSIQFGRESGNQIDSGWALHTLFNRSLFAGDYQGAKQQCQEAQEIWITAGNQDGLATTYTSLGMLEMISSFDLDAARELGSRGLAIAENINNALRIASGRAGMSLILATSGEFEQSLTYYTQAEPVLQAFPPFLAILYTARGIIAVHQEDYGEAKTYCYRAVSVAKRMSAVLPFTTNLVVWCATWAAEGKNERAVELLTHYLTHPDTTALKDWNLVKLLQKRLKDRLGEETYRQAYDRGKELDLDTVINELLTELAPDSDKN